MLFEKSLGNAQLMRMTMKNGDAPSLISSSPPPQAMDSVSELSTGPPVYTIPPTPPREESFAPCPKVNGWARAKLILGLASISNSLVTLMMMCVLIGSRERGSRVILFMAAPTFGSIMWNVADMGHLITHPGAGGIVSGAHVGVRLMLWGAWASSAALLPFVVSLSRPATPFLDYGWEYPTAHEDAPMTWTLVGLCALGALIEFVLFVRACCEEHWRLKEKKKKRMAAARKATGLH
ncbi:hypothetical protein ACHAQA_009760 [Verticillium albo-atrum]